MNLFVFTFIMFGFAPSVEYSGDSLFNTSEHRLNMPVVVYISGKISEPTAQVFTSQMYRAKETGQPFIPVVISSYGGSVYAMMEMIDTIDTIGVPVYTIVSGKAMSAGAALLSCGSKRYIMPNATVMIHEASSLTIGKVGSMEIDIEEAKRLNDLMLRKMAKNIGKPSSYFIDLIHERGHTDWYLTAEEAKSVGLVDDIGLPEFKVKVDVEVSFE